MAQTIAIVDYGMGNLRSVYQAFHHVAPGDNVLIAHQPEDIRSAARVVLPGQGAMPDCMKHLEESGLLEALLEAAKNKPLLGVCVGEQMLFDQSAEVRATEKTLWTSCLGLIPGEVRRFELAGKKQADGSSYKVPHMGWNQVRQDSKHPLWSGIPDLSSFYLSIATMLCRNAKKILQARQSTETGLLLQWHEIIFSLHNFIQKKVQNTD